MQELIEVKINENNEQVVSGRELHEFLEVKTLYKDWFPRMKEYGFVENIDFVLVAQKRATNNPKNPTTEITDHIMKISMAKEISMIQRNARGKKARLYFIECENRLKESYDYKINLKKQFEMIEDALDRLKNKEISASAARIIISGRKFLINSFEKEDKKTISTPKIKNNITIKIGEFLLKHKEELVDKGKKSLQPAVIFKMMVDEIDGFKEEFKSPALFSQRFKKTGEFGFLTIRKSDGRSWSFTTVGIEETLNSNN